jgi:hypothetical protein
MAIAQLARLVSSIYSCRIAYSNSGFDYVRLRHFGADNLGVYPVRDFESHNFCSGNGPARSCSHPFTDIGGTYGSALLDTPSPK